MKDDIDFSKWKSAKIKTTNELVKFFDKNMNDVKKALKNVSDEELEKGFSLKNKRQILSTSLKKETTGSPINHMAHHRGQLTVYMKLNGIPIPSIYEPSADDNLWK